MSDSETLVVCGHCGNKAYCKIKTKYHFDEITWRILQCPACSKPLLQEIYEVSWKESKILYPEASRQLSNLPEKVKEEYELVLKQKNKDPNTVALYAGRTLEAACKHEGITGNNLAQKIDKLAMLDRIPKTLAEMSHQLRALRNLGAHVSDYKVMEEDEAIILDFIELILEYLYVAPAKIRELQERLKR